MKDGSFVSTLRLLGVVGPPHVSSDSVVDVCRAAEAGGVTAVQVRWKVGSASDIFALTERLVEVLSIPVYVNDRADVAMAAGAVGVHLGADDLDPQRVRAMAPRPFRIGVSVGTEAEAARVREADVDYWSIGSFYRTGTKRDAGVPIGAGGFKRLAALAPPKMPVIAIGGIDRSNVAEVLRSGVAGVAVSGAVFGARDIEASSRELRTAIDSAVGSASA